MCRGLYRSIFILLILTLLASFAYAATEPADPSDLFCEPGRTAGGNPAFGGKPVSLFSGMETFAPSTDLSLGSLYPIRVTRSYNSRTTYDSPLGYGWAINYDMRLYTYADGSVTVRRECGGKKRFTLSGGNYVGQTADSGTLVYSNSTYIYRDLNGSTETYDASGKLLNMADAKGNSLQFYYEVDGKKQLWGLLPANVNQTSATIVAYDYRLSRIEEQDASNNPTNRWVLFYYNSFTGRLTQITDGTRTVTYSHDNIGNLKTASGPTTNATYGYSDLNNKHLITSIDEGNGAYVNTYDSSGRVARQVHGTGEIVFEYLSPLKQTRMTTYTRSSSESLLNTQTRTVDFDTNGMLVKVTVTDTNNSANNSIQQYIRDMSTTWVLAEAFIDISTGVTTTTAYAYDTKGNVLTKTEAQGTAIEKTTTYTYHPVFNGVLTETVQSVVNPALTRVITNTYDEANGNLLTTTETGLLGNGTPYSDTTTYTYGANGKLATIDGPRTDVSDVTTYNYDSASGNLLSMTKPLIGTTTYSNFDGLGNPQTVTDPNGNSTTYAYDNGRVSTVKAPGDVNPTQFFYVAGSCGSSCSGSGKIDHITMPEGNTITYTYDAMGNSASIKDSQNNSINYTYDSEGNKLAEEIRDSGSSLQKSLSYSYDALNWLKRVTNPDSSYTEYAYDAQGNKKSVKDPKNNLTSYSYDELSRLKIVTQPGPIDTIYGYNSNNNLTSVKDANNNTTTYIYDDKGRVYRVISPDTGTTTYAYDAAGNLVSMTDAKGITINYTYDALNRLTTIDYSTDVDMVYSYDTCVNGKGRLCTMNDASGSTTYEYSAKGQVTKETKLIDSRTYVNQYTYDQNGNMKTMTYPSGKVIDYHYTNDRVDLVKSGAANLATSIGYKPYGGVSSLVYGNGLTNTITYDTQYRLATLATGTDSLTYGYDNNGNTTSISPGKTYTYDHLDRLWTASVPLGSFTWTYDGVGNRQTENANTYTYTPNTNKLSSANGNSFGYDNNGNTTAEGARQFVYNQNQRLIQVVDSGVTKGEYAYNGNGQRVKKIVAGVTTIFHYSQTGRIIAESNSAGTITTEYVYLNGQPLAKLEGASTYYYHNDHLGTPQKMTDASGVVVWSADYKPFGEATVTPSSTITNNLRFPGQYLDPETGLHYNYYRDYDPLIGRYIEKDQVGISGGQNHLYAYSLNNPNRYYDPNGLAPSATIGPQSGNTTTINGSLDSCHYYQIRYQQTGCSYYSFVQPLCRNLFIGLSTSSSSPCVRQCLQEADMLGYAWDNCSRPTGCNSCPSIGCLYKAHMRCFNTCGTTILQHIH